jgi:hypothetical protein
MQSLKKTFSLLMLLLITLTGSQLQAQEADVLEEEGVIEQLILASNEVVISGVTFRVAYDAQVAIRGSYGAYTMLQPGMKVFYEYRRYSPTELEIFAIEQLPDNREIEEV